MFNSTKWLSSGNDNVEARLQIRGCRYLVKRPTRPPPASILYATASTRAQHSVGFLPRSTVISCWMRRLQTEGWLVLSFWGRTVLRPTDALRTPSLTSRPSIPLPPPAGHDARCNTLGRRFASWKLRGGPLHRQVASFFADVIEQTPDNELVRVGIVPIVLEPAVLGYASLGDAGLVVDPRQSVEHVIVAPDRPGDEDRA